jgi:coiled-coil domain-containing protein 55
VIFISTLEKMLHLVQKTHIVAKKQGKQEKQAEFRKLGNLDGQVAGETSDRNHAFSGPKFVLKSSSVKEAHLNETSPPRSSEPLDPKPVSDKPVSGTSTLKEKLQLNNHRPVNQITIIIKEIKMH